MKNYETLETLRSVLPSHVKSQDFKKAASCKSKIDRLEALDPYYRYQDLLTAAVRAQDFKTAARVKSDIEYIGGHPRSRKGGRSRGREGKGRGGGREEGGREVNKQDEGDSKEKENARWRERGDKGVRDGRVEGWKNISVETTNGVTVRVTTKVERIQGRENERKWSYAVSIRNDGEEEVRVVGRRFRIQSVGGEDAMVIKGDGVTGMKPKVGKGEVFEYRSGAPLRVEELGVEVGVAARMEGGFTCEIGGEVFEAGFPGVGFFMEEWDE